MRTITYTITSEAAKSPEHFYTTLTRNLDIVVESAQSLDTLTESLRTFIKSQEQPIIIMWKDHHIAQESLGYNATCQYYERQLQQCHPSEVLPLRKELERLKRKQKGLFDIVLETLQQSSNTITVIME